METLGVGEYLRFVRTERSYEYVEGVKGTGVVMIFPFTSMGEMVLIEMYRPPVKGRVIEPPGGLVGDLDRYESVIEAAKRELLEETGHASSQWTYLGDFAPSPAYSSHKLSIFKADECYAEGSGGGEDVREKIDVHVVSFSDLGSFLLAKMSTGVMVDPKVYSAMYFR